MVNNLCVIYRYIFYFLSLLKNKDIWHSSVDVQLRCCKYGFPFCPQVAAEVAAPLSQTKKVVMVSSGKGEVGAAKLTSEVLDVVEKLPLLVQHMTGVDISKVSRVTGSYRGEVCNWGNGEGGCYLR